MSRANPLWGAPRIHGELLKLGFDVAQSTVSRYMVPRPDRPGQSWRTFLKNHMADTAAIDFFIVPTIRFKLLYALAILRLNRRRLIHIAVTAHPTAEWTAQQILQAFPWDEAPEVLIRDRDAIYGAVFKKRLYTMGIRDGPTAARSPWQNGYVERLIGSIRRECLDHMIIRDEGHLHRILKAYTDYYNNTRTHLSLAKDAPNQRPVSRSGTIQAIPKLGGLHHQYIRI
jgi:transposase InsO family protein